METIIYIYGHTFKGSYVYNCNNNTLEVWPTKFHQNIIFPPTFSTLPPTFIGQKRIVKILGKINWGL